MRKLLSWRLAPRSHRGQGQGHLIPPIVHGVMEGEAEPQKKGFGAARAPVLPAAADQCDASVTRREMRTRLLANWRELAEKIFNPGQQPGLAQRTHRLSAGRCKGRQHRGKPSSPGAASGAGGFILRVGFRSVECARRWPRSTRAVFGRNRCQRTRCERRHTPRRAASWISCSRKSGWAMLIRASARCQVDLALSCAQPNSVTT